MSHYLHHPIEAFHRELISLVEHGRLAIAAPRYFAKSTYYSLFYPLFMALEYPGIEILLVSATGTLAEGWLHRIKTELEGNHSLMSFYGAQNPKMGNQRGKWTNDECHLLNGSVILAKGAGRQIRGVHPQILVGDDLETDEMVANPELMKKFDRWFWTDLMGMFKDSLASQVIIVGTILHPESFLANMIAKPPHQWVTKFYAAIKEDGTSLWPEGFPLTMLNNIRKERGEYFFSQEYMNTPIPDNLRVFQKKWLQYYEDVPPGGVYFTTVDPAISQATQADYTAIVTCRVDVDRNIHVVEVINKRLLPGEIVDAIFNVYTRYRPSIIGIETVGFQKMLKHDVEQERNKRHLYPLIRELKSEGRRKELRIQALQPFFESGKIFIKKSQEELITQLLRFPSAKIKDDVIDALAYQLDIIYPATEKQQVLDPDTVMATLREAKRVSHDSNGYYNSNEDF